MLRSTIFFSRAAIVFVLVLGTCPAAFSSTPRSPDAAAKALYNAWKLKSRKAAMKVADRSAVTKLLSTRWRTMKFEGCKNRDEGGFECIYRDKKLDLSIAMIVDGGVSAGGYNVTSVSFSSEN